MEEKIDKEKTDKITNVNISSEVKSSFLDYSMSVIVSRAIPDVRDGLKPVHRRILYTMFEEGMHPNRKHQKCANAVGAIMGHYHPHGDSAIYESMVRMAQDFTYRHTLVDGHGNFGSIDGDSAAAYRYTEARLSKISMELLRDITKETVDFRTNYDGQREEPEVLPSKFPNILVNGNMGIAVGMATNIPPHNLGEVIDGCVTYIDNPEISVVELMEHIKGPDFPTAATILGDAGIRQAYQTGKGSLTIESTVNIEEKKGKEYLIIKEIPYQVNKTSLITKIAELVSEKQIKGLTNLEDESALEGIRIVIEVKKGYNANVLLNNLYKLTQLQTRYHINFLMLVNGKPQTLGLIPILDNYLQYQKTIIIRRTKYDLNKFEKREHILKGLIIALNNIDEIIKIIKQSRTTDEIKKQFNEKYGLTEKQSIAILEMQLRRLSGLEREKIENELESISNLIKELKKILASDAKVLEIIKEELLEIKEKYATPRKTIIDNVSPEFIEDESLIPDEDVVITLTHKGYIKRITLETYKTQSRGGVGVKGMGTNEEDFVENLIYMTTHDYLMFFTNKGKTYRVKGYDVPVQLRQSKGLPIVNLLPLDEDETVKTMLKVSQDEESKYCLFCTEKGLVKRTKLEEFEKVRSSGKIAITLREGDSLIAVKKTTGNDQIIIASNNGKLIHIDEKEVSVSGRVAQGSIGIRMREGVVIGCEITEKGQKVLVVTENGYGKKTEIEKYRIIHRGGRGVKTLNKTPRTGDIVSIKTVDDDNSEDLMIVTNNGIIIRLPVEQVSHNDRVAHGARLIRLKEDQKVSTVTTIKNSIDEESS